MKKTSASNATSGNTTNTNVRSDDVDSDNASSSHGNINNNVANNNDIESEQVDVLDVAGDSSSNVFDFQPSKVPGVQPHENFEKELDWRKL